MNATVELALGFAGLVAATALLSAQLRGSRFVVQVVYGAVAFAAVTLFGRRNPGGVGWLAFTASVAGCGVVAVAEGCTCWQGK